MVLLEAMDAGCAIVTTNAEGCAEVVGDAGLVVPKGDPQGIRAALERLMRDPELVQNLAARARQRAATLTWPNIVGRYREVLQAAITQESARPHARGRQRSPHRRRKPCVDAALVLLDAVATCKDDRLAGRTSRAAGTAPCRQAGRGRLIPS